MINVYHRYNLGYVTLITISYENLNYMYDIYYLYCSTLHTFHTLYEVVTSTYTQVKSNKIINQLKTSHIREQHCCVAGVSASNQINLGHTPFCDARDFVFCVFGNRTHKKEYCLYTLLEIEVIPPTTVPTVQSNSKYLLTVSTYLLMTTDDRHVIYFCFKGTRD